MRGQLCTQRAGKLHRKHCERQWAVCISGKERQNVQIGDCPQIHIQEEKDLEEVQAEDMSDVTTFQCLLGMHLG